MATMARDNNGQAIQAVKPYEREAETTDGTFTPAADGLYRICTGSSIDASYGLNGAANIYLPGNVVEYVNLATTDVVTVSGTIQFVVCQ